MRLTLLMMVAAFSLWAGATETPDVFERYYDQVMVGQKWQFEVTDLDTDEISIADVKITGYAGDYPWTDELRYSVEVSFGEGVVENYVLWDTGQFLLAFSDKKNSYVAMADYDNVEGKPSESHWGNHALTVTEVDYVFVADRARKRIRYEDADNDYRSAYITGVGLDKFEIHSDDWNHNRSFRLLNTEYPDGTVLTRDAYESPRIVPDNVYYEDGMVLVYDWLNVPHYNKLYEEEYRVAGDTEAFHVPCKKIEKWKGDQKLGEFAVFDIAGQVYQIGFHYKNSFKPYVLYNLEVGDRLIGSNEYTEITDVFEIKIAGENRRVIKFAEIDEFGLTSFYGYWVEGVGPNQINGFQTVFPWSLMTRLNSLYIYGEPVFTYASLFKQDSIESIHGEERDRATGDGDVGEDTPLYNLQGMRIDRPVPGQPYIRDGRLIISRK